LAGASAQASGWHSWTNGGGDGKWETAANWNNGVPDLSNEAAIINDLATAGAVTADTGDYDIDYLRIGNTGTGTLNISGANITTDNTTRQGVGLESSSNTGTLNISSGSLTILNASTSISYLGATGTVNQTGGTMSLAGGATTSLTLGSTNGTALYNFTAGTLETGQAVSIVTSGTGTSVFQVNGYDAASSIQIGGVDGGDGAWSQGSGTTLSVAIDASTTQGSTLIEVLLGDSGDNDGIATFAAGSLLDLSFLDTEESGTWTIMSAAGGIVDYGLTFADDVDTDVWSFEIVDGEGDLDYLQVTALVVVPEPSAFALLMGGSALLWIGGRRRRS
jgi:hypothetical protein